MNNPNHEVIDLVTPPPSPPVVVNLVTPPPTPDVSDDERASSVGASSGGASSGGASSGGPLSGGASSGGASSGSGPGSGSGSGREIKFGTRLCDLSNKDKLSIQHFSFNLGPGSNKARAESLRKSFGISDKIKDLDEIRRKVGAVMTDVCTEIGPVYLTGAVDWALDHIDRKDAFEFNFLTSVKLVTPVNLEGEFVGFMTVKDNEASNSCDVTLLCAREGCGGFVYDHAEDRARRRGIKKVQLESVVDKYGFYRKKGFTSTTNKQLDVFWDKICEEVGIPDDDDSKDFFIAHFGKRRKLSGIWPTIQTSRNASTKNSVTSNLTRKFTRGKLVNIVIKHFGGSAETFFNDAPDVELSAGGGTISMEKNI